ncbi:patatin-like phospholipase family protein [uncultured Sphaerochaeta sp.]|uniref:patatin-like phospholipase family protein n=1 Tax=uncultured Sphaerochaeta sp. TaxID=886478 RepID=UPI002A0A9FB8|nr:patatin-like phospholipase family protein [uncultured Sphaerochaeta sp.]
MKRIVLGLTVLLCSFSLFATTPKVAVVLSGGGARGFAHIAVLEAIEKAGIPIDMVFGTSMGALVGGLYCAGYTPAEIRAVVKKIDMVSLFTEEPSGKNSSVAPAFDNVPANIFSVGFDSKGFGTAPGLVGDQKVLALFNFLLSRIPENVDFDDLAVPFRCVSTNLFSGRRIVYRDGSLVGAIRSSMSLPIVFTPYPQKDGSYAVDGGMVDNMPVQLAKDYGFDIVIACDVNAKQRTSDVSSLSSVLNQTLFLVTQGNVTKQYPLADILLFPELANINTMDFFKSEEIIKIGEQACEDKEQDFVQLAQKISQDRPLVVLDPDRIGPYSELPDPLITKVRIVDTSAVPNPKKPQISTLKAFIGLRLNETTKADLVLALNRIKKNYQLSSISYEMADVSNDEGTLLVNIRSFQEGSSKVSLGFNGSLGLSNNTPAAAGWIVPEVNLNAFFSHIFHTDFSFDTTLSVGQTLRLDVAVRYPFVATSFAALDIVANAAIFHGCLTPQDSKIYGNRGADLDAGFLFNLGLDYQFNDFGRANFGTDFSFVYIDSVSGGASHSIASPMLYGSVIWNTQQSFFSSEGIRAEFAATVGNPDGLMYSLRVAISNRFSIRKNDGIRWDLQISVMRLPYQLLSSYVEFGGFYGMPGYSIGTLKRDMIMAGVSWQHDFENFNGFPVHLFTTCRVGTADGYDPYLATSEPETSLLANSIGLEAGLGVMAGVETPIGNIMAGLGVSSQGNLALIVGIL